MLKTDSGEEDAEGSAPATHHDPIWVVNEVNVTVSTARGGVDTALEVTTSELAMVEDRTIGDGVDVDNKVTSTELTTVIRDDTAAGVDVATLVIRTVLTTVIGTAGIAAPVVPADTTGAADEVMTTGEIEVITLVTVTGAAAGRAVVITTDETEYNVLVTVTGAGGASDVVTVRADVDSSVFVTVKGTTAGTDAMTLDEAVDGVGSEAAGTGVVGT